jgi:hypothetical protein
MKQATVFHGISVAPGPTNTGIRTQFIPARPPTRASPKVEGRCRITRPNMPRPDIRLR